MLKAVNGAHPLLEREIAKFVKPLTLNKLRRAGKLIRWDDTPVVPGSLIMFSVDDGGTFSIVSDQFHVRSLSELANVLTPNRVTDLVRSSWVMSGATGIIAQATLAGPKAIQLYALAAQVGIDLAKPEEYPFPRRFRSTPNASLMVLYSTRHYPSSCGPDAGRSAYYCPADRLLTVRPEPDMAAHAGSGVALGPRLYHEIAHVLNDPPNPALQPFISEGRATTVGERWQQINLAAARTARSQRGAAGGLQFLTEPGAVTPQEAQRRLGEALGAEPFTAVQARAICSLAMRPLTFPELQDGLRTASVTFNGQPPAALLRSYQAAWAVFNFGKEAGQHNVLQPLDVRPVRLLGDRISENLPPPNDLLAASRRYIDQVNRLVIADQISHHLSCHG